MAGWRPQVVKSHAFEQVSSAPDSLCLPEQRRDYRGCEWSSEQLSRLAQTLAKEVIPHLSLSHRLIPKTSAAATGAFTRPATARDLDALVEVVLHGSDAGAFSVVQTLQARGVTVESMYVDLFAPAARRLGDLWCHNHCNGAELTLALCRLQTLLRSLSDCFYSELPGPSRERRVLFVAVPGEQHLFGMVMAAEFFFRAGWSVRSEFPVSNQALATLSGSERFDAFHVSLSCSLTRADRLEAVAAAIRAIRRASRNALAQVIVGGRAFVERPKLAAHVGADIAAPDARQEVFCADGAWGTGSTQGRRRIGLQVARDQEFSERKQPRLNH